MQPVRLAIKDALEEIAKQPRTLVEGTLKTRLKVVTQQPQETIDRVVNFLVRWWGKNPAG